MILEISSARREWMEESWLSLRKLSFTPSLQRGAATFAWDWKPFKRFSVLFAVLTPG
jgi:hypothetical protein